ncbi:MarR family transcriptional regulator [Streptomyces sp. NPDC094472]|uniref:MarR family winged helix-turn-helix transcriptional regulator n=1 Tax=unclassified Streptomyces TaxID=2593676 RepID=UPI0033294E6B
MAARTSETTRPGELAAELQMTTPNMTAALRALEDAGMVKRRPDPSDGRKVFVDVTAYGHDIVEQTSYGRHAWLHEAVENVLNERERRLLFEAGELLQRLADYNASYRRPEGSKAG